MSEEELWVQRCDSSEVSEAISNSDDSSSLSEGFQSSPESTTQAVKFVSVRLSL